jgi:hypothetical protein
MREAEQAQRLAAEREDNARADLERIGKKTRAEVLELGEKLGDAKKATELAEGVTADQANQLRALRTENHELQATRTALDDQLAERNRADKGFVPQPTRWIVEQTYGTLMLHRRLVRDYEHLPATSESRVYWAMTDVMSRRLTRAPAPSWRST